MPCQGISACIFFPWLPFTATQTQQSCSHCGSSWASLPLASGCVDPMPVLMAQSAVSYAEDETVQSLTLVIGSWSCRTSLFISITSVICAWTCPEQHAHTTLLSLSQNQKLDQKHAFPHGLALSPFITLNTKLVGAVFVFEA